jgi:glycosyltransferase involved in cell wall biosynthesis
MTPSQATADSTTRAYRPRSSSSRELSIFVPHCSSMLTDHLPHGDGQIAYGFLKHLSERGHALYVATPRAELRSKLPLKMQVHVIRTWLKGPFARLEYMVRVRLLFERLRQRNRFDLIHQMNPVFSGVSLFLRNTDTPIVLGTYVARWPAENAIATWQQKIAAWVRRRIDGLQQRQASALLLTAPAARNRLADPKTCDGKVRWISHGVDTDLFAPWPEEELSQQVQAEQQNPSILFLANVSRRKGIVPMLHAFAAVLREVPKCRLTVAGKGPDSDFMKQLAKDLGVSDNVTFLGHCDREFTPNLYRTHAVYCLPSLGEPYATSVLEAMSCGRPLVITDAGGLPAMVPPNGGLRVPAGESNPLALALIGLLRSPEERKSMGRVNREHVLQNMQWASVIDVLESVYREVLTANRQGDLVGSEPAYD